MASTVFNSGLCLSTIGNSFPILESSLDMKLSISHRH